MKNVTLLFCLLYTAVLQAQFSVRTPSNANDLAQAIVGNGITVSNVTVTGAFTQTGIFKNSNTIIPYDSGIVLTTGRARTTNFPTDVGLDGPAANVANITVGTNNGYMPLTLLTQGSFTQDAAVLEFDFVPIGDTVRFNYIFSSDEYPEYNCSDFNDIFAFFISGPGIVGTQNIALIPGTNIPVTINSINNGIVGPQGDAINCPNVQTQLYVSNINGMDLAHNGMTVSLTAKARVTPCQTYHLTIAIADVGDGQFDSGVFLKAGSLTSTIGNLSYQGTIDASNNQKYTAEGCTAGSIKVSVPLPKPTPTSFSLVTAGTATNGVDIVTIPATVTVPANTLFTTIPITAITDGIAEGNEFIKVYLTTPCTGISYLDSVIIWIRDFDTLKIMPNSPVLVCAAGNPLQLNVSGTYAQYQWDADPTLSATNINNPIASPTVFPKKYYCTATLGTCSSRDSVEVLSKNILSQNFTNVNCKNAATGSINIVPGPDFARPIQFKLNNGPNQLDSNFNNLPTGMYTVTLTDATNCVRNFNFTLTQNFPDLTFTEVITPATCLIPGTIIITAAGGNGPYQYSIDGTNYFLTNNFQAPTGNITLFVKDVNNCITQKVVTVSSINTLSIVNLIVQAAICSTVPTGTITVDAINGTPPYQYSLSANSGYQNANMFTVFEGVRKVYAKDANGCIDSIIANVPLINNLIINAGNDTAYCEGNNVQLNATSNASVNVWSPNVNISNSNILNPQVNPPTTQKYYLTGTTGSCTKIDSMTVVFRPAPIPNAGADSTICFGRSTILNGTGGLNYVWAPTTFLSNTNTFNPLSTPTTTITYGLNVTDLFGCASLMADSVTVTVTPPIFVQTINDTLIAAGQPLNITTTGTPFYTWTPASNLSAGNIGNPIATFNGTGLYKYIVRGYTASGCAGEDTVTINVYKGPDIYVPTAFTPNGDGKNDVFRITAVGLKSFSYLRVYNRWGQQVFATSNPNQSWNGRTKNGAVVPGTYVWQVEGIDYQGKKIQRKGTLLVLL